MTEGGELDANAGEPPEEGAIGMRRPDVPHAFVVSPQDSGDEDDERSLDLVADTSNEESRTFDDEAQEALRTHLRLYAPRERLILALRYGLKSEEIVPEETSYADLERVFEETRKKHEDGDIHESLEKFLDSELAPVVFTFMGLPTEQRIELAEFRALKAQRWAGGELAARVLPHDPAELDEARRKATALEGLSGKESTLLALLEGREFDRWLELKPRDRLVMKGIWLHKAIPPSAVNRMLQGHGLILDEVAQIFNLTKERVRQIEARVLRHISYHLVLP